MDQGSDRLPDPRRARLDLDHPDDGNGRVGCVDRRRDRRHPVALTGASGGQSECRRNDVALGDLVHARFFDEPLNVARVHDGQLLLAYPSTILSKVRLADTALAIDFFMAVIARWLAPRDLQLPMPLSRRWTIAIAGVFGLG